MTGIDRRLRDLLEAAAGEPPHQVSAEAVRRRVSRRRAREYLAGAAAVAVIAAMSPWASGQPAMPLGRPDATGRPARPSTWPTASPMESAGAPLRSSPSAEPPARPETRSRSAMGRLTPTAARSRSRRTGRPPTCPPAPPARSSPSAQPPTGRASRSTSATTGRLALTSSRSPRTGGPPTSPAWPLTRSPRSARRRIRRASRSASGSGPVWIAITPDGQTAYVADRKPAGHGHPDRHGDQHRWRADPRQPRPVRYRDHSGREDRLRPQPFEQQAHQGCGDAHQHGQQHPGPADLPPWRWAASASSRSPRTGRRPMSPPATRARSSRSARPPTGPGSRSRSATTTAAAARSRSPRTGRPPMSSWARTKSSRSARPPTPQASRSSWDPPAAPSCSPRPSSVWRSRPDGKTLYIACEGAVIPVSTATNTPGRPVRLPLGYPFAIAIKP